MIKLARLGGLFLIYALLSSCNSGAAETQTPTPMDATTLLASTPTSSPTDSPAERADIIFHNGAVITLEESLPVAEAIAIQGELILAVGTDEEILRLQGAETVLIDLQGHALSAPVSERARADFRSSHSSLSLRGRPALAG